MGTDGMAQVWKSTYRSWFSPAMWQAPLSPEPFCQPPSSNIKLKYKTLCFNNNYKPTLGFKTNVTSKRHCWHPKVNRVLGSQGILILIGLW